jgi:hypothetical protein
MRSVQLGLLPFVALAAVTACSSSSSSSSSSHPASDPPHALGAIVLGESHAPGGASTAVIEATFVPDSSATPKACSTAVGACTVLSAPICGSAGCPTGQSCTWDASCTPVCQAECTLQCPMDQECYFPSPNQSACRVKQSFDGGALVFIGTTTPLTLFPPYTAPQGGGAPFAPGASIEVQGSGASGTGFDKFDVKDSATSLVRTSPALSSLADAVIFGLGTVPVGWVPGSDTVTVTLAGAGGVATCPANDASGHFDVPRDAITAALGKNGGSTLTVAVTRERDAWDKAGSTHGALTGATVQPVGWLELSTISTEMTTFQGCSGTGETYCPDGCFDTSTDPLHCGSCSVVCSSSQVCLNGQCATGGL